MGSSKIANLIRFDTLLHLVKDSVTSLLHCIHFLLNSVTANKLYDKTTMTRLKTDGIYICEEMLTASHVEVLRNEVDRLLDQPGVNVWRDKQCSDERIYFAEELSPEFQGILDLAIVRDTLKNYLGYKKPVGFMLAGRITAREGNEGSGGGWHRDSPHSKQFKSIFYLNDVDEKNGPFQYAKGSHRFLSTVSSYLKTPMKPGQYRYDNDELEKIVDVLNLKLITNTGKAGTTIFVDTKGIHRGAPLVSGRRYALFCYFFDGEIPKHFDQYRQQKN